jgi:nucleoside-diphosphate-sugar epimerase
VRVLVTGASGFVGNVLCGQLSRAGHRVRAALRRDAEAPAGAAEVAVVGEIDGETRWDAALDGVDGVIHLAARAHVMNDGPESRDLYFRVNAAGTRALAVACAGSRVSRLVYLSSIKVNGEATTAAPFTAEDAPRPQDAYGESKWRGEQHVAEVSEAGGPVGIIVRSPLVYGPGVRANFRRLLDLVWRETPLPLGAVRNARSIISVWNLCDVLCRGLDAPLPRGASTILVSDGPAISTPELVTRIARALNRRPRLIPVPPILLRLGGLLTGRGAEVARICDSLDVDISSSRRLMGWQPPLTLDEGLARTAEWYRGQVAHVD